MVANGLRRKQGLERGSNQGGEFYKDNTVNRVIVQGKEGKDKKKISHNCAIWDICFRKANFGRILRTEGILLEVKQWDTGKTESKVEIEIIKRSR